MEKRPGQTPGPERYFAVDAVKGHSLGKAFGVFLLVIDEKYPDLAHLPIDPPDPTFGFGPRVRGGKESECRTQYRNTRRWIHGTRPGSRRTAPWIEDRHSLPPPPVQHQAEWRSPSQPCRRRSILHATGPSRPSWSLPSDSRKAADSFHHDSRVGAVLFQLVVKRPKSDPQLFGRHPSVAPNFPQGPLDGVPLQIRQCLATGPLGGGRALKAGKMFGLDPT